MSLRLKRSFVFLAAALVVLLVPLAADAPVQADHSGCDWGCDSAYSYDRQARECSAGGRSCMWCDLKCPY